LLHKCDHKPICCCLFLIARLNELTGKSIVSSFLY
jgi:hypothetical protein